MNWATFNYVEFLFINITVMITIIGGLIVIVEPYIPKIISQIFRYGKHTNKKEEKMSIVKMFELPKSWFRHFYVFGLLFSSWGFYYTIRAYIFGIPAPDYLVKFLDLCCGVNRKVRTNPLTTLIGMSLLYVQSIRRFYETHVTQIFSKTATIHIAHYLVGFYHYFGAIVIILSQAQGFVKGTTNEHIAWNQLKLRIIPFSILFLYAWFHQYDSNRILVNLRRNKNGKVVTEKHLMPEGGYFKYVSSPHMFFEVVMYVALFFVLLENTSWLYVLAWVIFNQAEVSYLTHIWYKENFPNYPEERKALIPGIF